MAKTHSQYRKVCSGRDFIADHYMNSFDLVRAASQAHLSPYHFLRTFKKTFGETPNGFLIRLRMDKAKSLLITGNASVTEICEQVGYTSVGSFSTLFAQQVGVAPSAYRRRLWSLSAESFRYPVQAIPACYAFQFLGKNAVNWAK